MQRSIIAVLFVAAAQPAFAQDPEDAVIVTATRFPERRLDAPVGMTIISAGEIARDTARTLPELLSRLGGMQVRNNSGSPDLQIDLRGFGITGDQNTLVLLDGIRLNENDLSPTKLSAIPLQSIERIEILRGSGAVLYGGGASGGTINIITRGPRPQHKDAEVFLGAGSYGTGDARASVNLAGERFGALVSGSHSESDNYRVNNRVRQDNAGGDVRFNGDAGSLAVKFGADYQRLQLPGTRDQNQLAGDPRGTATPDDWSTRDGEFVTLQGRRQAGEVELAADLGYRDQLATANFVSFLSYSEAKLNNLAFSPRLRWNTAPLGVRSSLVVGADWGNWDYDRRIAADPASISMPTSTTRASQESNAFYTQYNAQLTDAAKLTLGWRSQRISDDLVQAGFFSSAQNHVRTPHSGEAAIQYALAPSWTVFGRLATSFRVANVDENGFTASGNLLEPQTARHREAGAEYRNNGFKLRANFYQTNLDNEIYFSPIVVPFGANTNLSPTRRTGVELFGSLRLSSEFELSGNVIYQTAKFTTGVYGGIDVTGKDIPLVPRALANLRAAWQFAPKTQMVAAVSYVGRQRYDNDQDNAFAGLMPSYFLADLKLARAVAGWKLSAAINNLFDKKYYSYGIVNAFGCATPVCAYPQAGRTLFAGAEHAFK
ncbi:MAG: TonB-dependent receptor [Burkholderiales bacterium]